MELADPGAVVFESALQHMRNEEGRRYCWYIAETGAERIVDAPRHGRNMESTSQQ